MSALAADGALMRTIDAASFNAAGNAEVVARLERLPVTSRLKLLRVIVGVATFFDAYTVLAIAFAMPQLVSEWKLTPTEVGLIISAGYVGQLFGAVFFGSLAERIGRLKTLFITVVLFTSMDVACLFAWSGVSMMVLRFLQGVGTGGEVPVASAYINEFIGAEKRGRFFLLYEVIFPIGLMFAGMAGYFLVPIYGWQAMFKRARFQARWRAKASSSFSVTEECDLMSTGGPQGAVWSAISELTSRQALWSTISGIRSA
jgi:MFS transporter, putative metabolite:H+ symporter